MAIDEEILTKFHELKNIVNDIHNLDEVFPSDLSSIELLIPMIAYYINPTDEDLDALTYSYSIVLPLEAKKTIYPLIIEFVLFVKKKYLNV